MPLTAEEAALLSKTDLEVAWLRKVSGNLAPNTLSDLRAIVMPEGEHAYWADASGLTPSSEYSVVDHKIFAMKALTPSASGSISDVERAFFASNLP